MLKMLGREEIDGALDELGQLAINCDFCGKHYEFDKVDCAQLFVGKTPVEELMPASGVKH
jgi:molecular chaperone Hsp33